MRDSESGDAVRYKSASEMQQSEEIGTLNQEFVSADMVTYM